MKKDVFIDHNKQFGPPTIIVKFRINPHYARQIKAQGFDMSIRTVDYEHKKIDERTREAIENGVDPYAHNRIDAAGNEQVDSGYKPFGEGKYGMRLNGKEIWNSLFHAGYQVQKYKVFRKEGDNMSFIEFVLIKAQYEGEQFQSLDAAADFFEFLCNKVFDHVHIWHNRKNNRNDVITINCGHISQSTNPAPLLMFSVRKDNGEEIGLDAKIAEFEIA